MAKTRYPINSRDEAPPGDYIVARLALWAGDVDEAKSRLSTYRGGAFAKGWLHLLNISAVRTRRQLARRRREYATIYAAAGVRFTPAKEHVLRSKGLHLGAVVWVENEREYELRVFLLDVAWEASFYRMARDHTQKIGGMGVKLGGNFGYGLARSDGQARQTVLGLEWAIQGTMFLHIVVSDFGTVIVQGIWTGPQLPTRMSDIIQPFQVLLDQWDP